MDTTARTWIFGTLFIFLALCTLGGFAQSGPEGARAIPLTVPADAPLHIALDQNVPIKLAGTPVEGHVLEPVYVFDHLVIPAGTKVLGRVTEVDQASRGRRALAIANGNFSPLRTARVDFNTLVLKDGTRIPLHARVSPGTPEMVHLTAGGESKKKKGRVGTAVAQARAEVKAREQQAAREVKEAKAPGKMQRVKAALIAELPYHKPKLPAGTHFTAELTAPLAMGQEERSPAQLESLGSEIPPASTVYVRLLTGLSSATDRRGSPVEAVVSEPVFSSNHQLILPEGARLTGSVTLALPARRLGRNGQLRFYIPPDRPGS